MPQEPVHPYLRDWTKQGTFEMSGVVGGTWGWAAIDALNNRNAMVNVAFRERGEHPWTDALPLLRNYYEIAHQDFGPYGEFNPEAGVHTLYTGSEIQRL